MHLRGAAGGPLAMPSSLATAALGAAHAASSGASAPSRSPRPLAFSQALRTAMAGAAGHPAGRGGRDRPSVGKGAGAGTGARADADADELDAAARQLAHLAPPALGLETPIQPLTTTLPTPVAPAPSVPTGPGPSLSLEELLPALVRKIAWSGDARRGTVRIELGAGALAGATLLVASDGGRVQVTLSAGSDVELEPWRDRIAARLADRGLDADVT
jgi:hypothetical protein